MTDYLKSNKFVILGAASDLTCRTLMPGLFAVPQSRSVTVQFSISKESESLPAAGKPQSRSGAPSPGILMTVLDARKASPPNDFSNSAGGTCGPEAMQALLVYQKHSWPAPVEPAGVHK